MQRILNGDRFLSQTSNLLFAEGEKEILLGNNGFTDVSVIPQVIPQRENSCLFRHPGHRN